MSTLAASPDCARWLKDYQQGLANHASHAKKHVVRAARRLTVPHLRLAHAAVAPHRLRPARLSPQEMLKRFRVLCGEDLPDDAVPTSFVPTSLEALVVPPVAFPDATPVTDIGQPVTFAPGTDTPAQPAVTTTPTGGAPPIVVTDSGPPTGTPNTTPPVVIPNVPVPVPSPVPEPGSLVLLLTGFAGGIPILLRRRRA